MAALPALTGNFSGLVNGGNTASLMTQPAVTTTATAASHVSVALTPSRPAAPVDADYTISYVPGALTAVKEAVFSRL